MSLRQKLYELYAFKFDQNTSYSDILARIRTVALENHVFICDLSKESREAVISRLNAVITSERSRVCESELDKFFLNLFILPENEHFGLLSISADALTTEYASCKKLAITLFKRKLEDSSCWTAVTPQGVIDSEKYWKNVSADLKPEDFTSFSRSTDVFLSDNYILDSNITESFISYIKNGNDPVTLLNAALGELVCALTKSDKVMLNSVVNAHALPCAPLIYDRSLSRSEALISVEHQLKRINVYGFCSKKELFSYLGNRFENRILVTSYYADENSYSHYLRRIINGELYYQPAIDTVDSPINLFFNVFNDSISVSYLFSHEYKNKYDFSKISDALSSILLSMINKKFSRRKSKDFSVEQSGLSRLDMIKYNCIRKMDMFSDFSDEEIVNNLSSFRLEHKGTNHIIAAAGMPLNSMYILCSGNVQANGVNFDLVSNPLYILRSGEVFGVESLLSNKISPATYIAYTNNVFVMTIDTTILNKMFEAHPEMLRQLLSSQTELLHRFQKLWVNS